MSRAAIGIVILLGLITGVRFFQAEQPSKTIHIGILVPIDHLAFQEMVAGFKEAVNEAFPSSVRFTVQNAQGDLKLQRNILESLVGQSADMIVPIGTTATQMALSVVKKQPILSLASSYTEAERRKRYSCNITGVLDEIGGRKKIEFIKAILPNIQALTLIFHGANQKNYQEIEELKSYAKESHIELQFLMIQHLPDLNMVGRSILPHSQAILILKDEIIASGIRMLIPIAKHRGIPLITSDEGTIAEGSTLALGVSERRIGKEGGKIAVQILKGYPIQDIPLTTIEELTVFYNSKACQQQNIEVTKLQEYANKHHYNLVDSAVVLPEKQ